MTLVTLQYSTFTGSVSTAGSQYVLLAIKWHASHIMVIKNNNNNNNNVCECYFFIL